jgi:hypothetical protein
VKIACEQARWIKAAASCRTLRRFGHFRAL